MFVCLFPWTMFPWHFGRVHLPLYIVVTTTGSFPPDDVAMSLWTGSPSESEIAATTTGTHH